MTSRARERKKERVVLIPVGTVRSLIAVLDYEVSSYDLSARFAQRKGYRTLMVRKREQMRAMVKRLRSALARKGKKR